jgi:hypothetical protein
MEGRRTAEVEWRGGEKREGLRREPRTTLERDAVM